MRTIGIVALAVGAAGGVLIQRSSRSEMAIFERGRGGAWTLTGTLVTRPSSGSITSGLPVEAPPSALRAEEGDIVVRDTCHNTVLPVKWVGYRIDRAGSSVEFISGRFRYYSVIWALASAPFLLWTGVVLVTAIAEGPRRPALP